MKSHKIAIAGATGQVGAALVRRLHEEGWHVVATTRNAMGAALVHASVPTCDIRVGSLARSHGKHLIDDCDIAVNCALAESAGDPRKAYVLNRAIVDGLMEAKSLRRLIHLSTVAVFGELISEYRDEQRAFNRPRPDSEYGRSKLYVERYAARQSKARRIQATLLRLGHVYGAGVPRSLEMIDLARDPGFRLPFDGRLPSNAIHIDQIAASITALIGSDSQHGTYNLAEKDSTWRDVFDWHTSCLSLPTVRGMSDSESEAVRALWTHSSIPREFATWVRSLPVKRLVRGRAMFDVALRILAHTPNSVNTRIASINRRVASRGAVAAMMGGHIKPLPPPYLSAGMPGPFLHLAPIPPTGAGSESERRRELREWYHLLTTPRVTMSPRFESGWSGATGSPALVGAGSHVRN